MPIDRNLEGMGSTPSYKTTTWSPKSRPAGAAPFQKITVKGSLMVIQMEWLKELKADEFCRNHLRKYLTVAMDQCGQLVIDRAKVQASGARAKRVGAGKWENIRRWYAAPPLTPPELVRIFTGRYRQGFLKQTEPHPTLCKASVSIGNRMFYAKYVEARKANLTNAMLALWTPILTKAAFWVGLAFSDWEKMK